jgi:plasmid stability protein
LPDILVRDLPVELKKEIERRARKSGRSLSGEVKALLQDAMRSKEPTPETSLWSRMRDSLPEDCRLDQDLVPPRSAEDRPPPEFS